MLCPNCQKSIEADSFFCQWCRSYLPNPNQGTRPNLFERWLALVIDPLIGILLFLISTFVFGSLSGDLAFFATILFPIVYLIWYASLFRQGMTPGKKVMGLRVVRQETGKIPGFGVMILREFIGRPLSALFLGFGYFWALFDKNSQGWHDKLAGTVVIKRRHRSDVTEQPDDDDYVQIAHKKAPILDSPRLLAKEETIQAKLHEKPLDTDLLMQHARALKDLGRMTEAAKEAEKVLGINEKQRDAAVFLANLYHELGDGNRATELVSLINGLDNTSPSAYGEMASLYSKIEGDLEQAILVVSNGLKAYPDDPHLLAQLTSLRVAAGDTESALALSEEELGKLSASPEVLASLLSTAVEAKQFAEAYRIARELHKHDVNNRSACLFALVDEVREDFQHQTFDNPAKFTERMSRIDLTGLSSVEHRHYQFLSGLTNLRGNQSISESLSKVKRVLSVDSEIYSIWKDVLDRTFSSIAGSTESPAEMHMLLDHFTPLSKQLKSDELMTLAADTSRRLGEHYENNGDWANAERLFALSLQLNENEQVQKALDRVSLRSRKKTLKIAGIATAVVVVAVGAGLLYYFGQGQIEITSTPAATIKVLKGEKVVFEAQPSEGDSVSHVVTPFLLFGDYTVQAERPGYSSDPNQIAVGFGRSTTSCSASMNPQYGGLRLDSYPKGAEVYLDDDFVGKAPIALDSLLAKPTRISVRHNEYNAFIKDIGIVSDTAIDLGTIKFESFLSVDSRPSGANVYVSERLIGKTPIRDASVEAKTSNVRIEVTGQAVFGDSSVFFSPGVTVDLGAILLKPAGSIQVSSSPSACAVYVDGKFRGNTPTSIQTMGTGRHQIEGRRPFFEPAIASVSVKEGKTQDVQLRLKQFDGDWIVNAYMQPQFFGKADPREGKGRSTRLFFLRIEDIGNGHLDAYLCDSLFFLHSSAWTRIHQEATLTRRLLYDYSFYSILPWSDKCALSKSDDNIAIQINEAKADNGIWDIELNMCKDGRHMLGYLKVKRQGYLVGSTVSFTLHLFAERVK